MAKQGINTIKFKNPIDIYNADGSNNQGGQITSYALLDITIGNHMEKLMFLITDLGKADMFLGYEWVKHHNPSIDWKMSYLEFNRCPETCVRIRQIEIEEEVEEGQAQ